jgi:hypothetical protein
MRGMMRTEDAIKYFDNSVRALAEALGITREAVYQWGDTVPRLRAYEIRDLLAARQAVGAGDTAPEPHQETA